MNYNIKEKLAAIYIWLTVICMPASAVQSISLHFFDSALVNNKVVYMNDIAEIKGDFNDNNGIDLNEIIHIIIINDKMMGHPFVL